MSEGVKNIQEKKQRMRHALELFELLHKEYMQSSDPLKMNLIEEVQIKILEIGAGNPNPMN